MMVLRLLKIPKSTYFDWVHYTESQRQREDTILKALLREIWQNNYKAYGAPRLRLALADLNLHHGTQPSSSFNARSWHILCHESSI
ncbi:Uncharacterized protein BN962_00911 [Leuconostoc citreum]|nr:Uncharacterized protein BN962_00034 [Leuconostoc citreum]CDX63904.1 Uncharacterized protein BN962_00048 [Leuconostoc citreum]CDX63932.1 Uncharacterized protein BN962_00077 [Leuconostoc citreum]CDX64193.1 Uncharacterized protein BN962_00347 [Leuconostoc citreum]CDX64633.1 Uncharacterized protein BN962_00796 [Leuconostoc citreum]